MSLQHLHPTPTVIDVTRHANLDRRCDSTLNEKRYLPRTLLSLRQLRFDEVVLVDGGHYLFFHKKSFRLLRFEFRVGKPSQEYTLYV